MTILIGLAILLFVVFAGLVSGTRQKFESSGIDITGSAKWFFFIIPLDIIYIHLRLAFKSLKKDKGFAMYMFKLILFKYPIAVGVLIELMLEDMAFELSENERIARLRKRRDRVRVIRGEKHDMSLSDVTKEENSEKLIEVYKGKLAMTV
ncbi:hypothetical protein [Terribacillus sp. JSM ZJ617]|uniref:hypothetical protein n=1 Tax=Terribacillus sp. JSM ZJ617 TaxID=3342119 RepID=UPI0035A9AB35